MNENLSEDELRRFAAIAYRETGIRIAASKLSFMQNRLGRRLRELGLTSFQKYYQLLRRQPEEMRHFIGALTTNETYFFRCPRHFYLLSKTILPQLTTAQIDVWSAACSTGAEPYSLAIVLRERLARAEQRKVTIFASDIDLKVLQKASEGIYDDYALRMCGKDILEKYFRPRTSGTWQIIPPLREQVLLGQHNLKNPFPKGKVDILFCRNVLIYFDASSKQLVFENLVNALKPGGYLFLGESEIIPDLDGMERIESSVARKRL